MAMGDSLPCPDDSCQFKALATPPSGSIHEESAFYVLVTLCAHFDKTLNLTIGSQIYTLTKHLKNPIVVCFTFSSSSVFYIFSENANFGMSHVMFVQLEDFNRLTRQISKFSPSL